MSYNPYLISRNIRDMEYNKYTEIVNDTRFPQITSVIESYDIGPTGQPQAQTNYYNKTAELVYLVNASDINQNITLSATNIQVSNVGITGVAAVSGTVNVQTNGTYAIAVSSNNTNVTNTVAVSGNVAATGNVGVAAATNWYVTQVQVTTAGFTPFPSLTGRVATVVNTTGDTLLLTRAGQGIALPFLNNSSLDITLTNNVSEIQLKAQTLVTPGSAYALVTNY